MTDPQTRNAIAMQLGALLLSNIEVSVQLEAAKGYIAALEKTQSKGKAKAEKLLGEQGKKR